ncbi:MAG: glycine cleavage system aminomethyltransferase GcvT [Gammaproteobacteria bacterium]|nr:glycine cleavage system aminomethyltransferase GcvT [Gammaproteobacteria bacterium]
MNTLNTALYEWHLSQKGKMVPFAGYNLPIYYATGLLQEHLHTRNQVGLFDISHMGQISLSGQDSTQLVELLLPIDAEKQATYQQKYALLLNQQGGILDDLMVVKRESDYFLVVNGACKHKDFLHIQAVLQENFSETCRAEWLPNRSLLALQGPLACTILEKLVPKVAELLFLSGNFFTWNGHRLFITRSGYTGEDGFEISLPDEICRSFVQTLMQEPAVLPIGLGARNSLRLEAGLCLYGNDLNEQTTPMSANLLWSIPKTRRAEGDKAGKFIGWEKIFEEFRTGTKQKRHGFVGLDKIPIREGTEIVDEQQKKVGIVTSGLLSPSLGLPIGFVMLEQSQIANSINSHLYAMVRTHRIPIALKPLPFVPHKYHRNK